MKYHIMRRPEVEYCTGLSRSTIYAMMAKGTFPKPIQLSKRSVGWADDEVLAWLQARILNRTAN